MASEMGYGILAIAFVLSLFSSVAATLGYYFKSYRWIEYARRAQQLTLPLLLLVTATLIYLLVTGHYEVKYVYSVTEDSMPVYLKITALWGGQPGSLLFWSFLLSVFSTAITLFNWKEEREFLSWVIVVTSFTLAFFLALTLFIENPFARWWYTVNGDYIPKMFAPPGARLVTPNNGMGLNPLLRHPGMIVHPPLLYLGFVSIVIPYSFAIASLVTGRSDNQWLHLTRRWSLLAWFFLSLGLLLGMRWAYDVLGWGGYWGWDPVEIAALLPWLTATSFLHSIITEEKRGLLKQWNIVLIILTFELVIFGTFLTRSGIFSSVHAFAQSSIGPAFFIFISFTLIFSTAVLMWRWKILTPRVQMKSMLSKEALFLVNNLLFMGVVIICLWGVLFPLVSELFTGIKVTIGPPFYEKGASPLLAGLMGLMGIVPFSAWGKSTVRTIGHAIWKPGIPSVCTPIILYIFGFRNWIGLVGFTLIAFVVFVTMFEYYRGIMSRMKSHGERLINALIRVTSQNQRRYGGYIIHLAMVTMAIGILGIELFQASTQGNLDVGESMEISGYRIQLDAVTRFMQADGRLITRAVMSVYQGEKYLQEIYPRYDIFPSGQPMTVPGVRSTLVDDLYVVLINWEDTSDTGVPIKIYHNPLINFLWIGAVVLIFGYLVAAWPRKVGER